MKINKNTTNEGLVSDDTSMVPADVNQTVEPCENESGFVALMSRIILRHILNDAKL